MLYINIHTYIHACRKAHEAAAVYAPEYGDPGFVHCIGASNLGTAIPMIIEGQFQILQRFSSRKLVLKTVESGFLKALNYYENGSSIMRLYISEYITFGCGDPSFMHCIRASKFNPYKMITYMSEYVHLNVEILV
jgi:hypothetical protein